MNQKAMRTGRWGQERRLEFIDFRLMWEGKVNRSDLIGFFQISMPQASLDLARYLELAPDNLTYDRTAKAYVASDDFKPILCKADSDTFLKELLWRESGALTLSESFIGWAPETAAVPFPNRHVSTPVLVGLLRTIRSKRCVVIGYQSMAHPDPADRLIIPTAFGFDGFRWHLRAYCFKSEAYKDYVLGRIYSLGDAVDCSRSIPEDTEWQTYVDLVIAPNPNYSEPRRQAIERDYEMVNGEIKIRTRIALQQYVERRLGLGKPSENVSDQHQIVLLRVEEAHSS
ncbi:WYL domain-containing protein [Pseudomonas cannabina]|uniref:WYL domain-containing protein n=1 Tax=Pseudomonas syringae pv. maculicola str. ES4326 TaxID=629265 RepID=A0A8T8C1V9_PSEYM|nr:MULTISPECIES: WYL domain-containing protein [Pseudomonas syringae group]QHE97287.1 hypothetical protein PMA4326_012105 [Pseudomonas syringae pv. maculicola str. ES4326]QQN24470.1 hypothetical protein JGS08_13230 [Pseudomonas cannabina pv. alisalensis]UBY97951.1 WYL domain-containing protein [Pseudomonas cannabina pv. alisalensis]